MNRKAKRLQERKARKERARNKAVVRRSREIFERLFLRADRLTREHNISDGIVIEEAGSCLYQAAAVVLAGQEFGKDLLLQAGTAAWPRIPLDQDDGRVHTHFAYEFEGLSSPAVQQKLEQDLMPEMHVWVADPLSQEIIDITTRFLAVQCERTAGMPWTAKKPPDFLWSRNPPHAWVYNPSVEATEWANAALEPAFAAVNRVLARFPDGRNG